MRAPQRTIRRLVLALATGAACVAYYACAVYEPSLLLATSDAGADVGPPGDGGGDGDTCAHARVPARTGREDDGGAPPGDLIFAVNSIDFDVDAGGKDLVGYDLDDVCTCPGQPSCKNAKPTCDDSHGRDNGGGALFASFSSLSDAFKADAVNLRFQDGTMSLLVRVRNYNGTANDPQVETAVFLSNGTEGSEDGGTPTKPNFDGNDVWTVEPKSLLGGIAPPYIPDPDNVDTSSYVVSGKLVASISRALISFAAAPGGASSLTAELSGVLVTGDLGSDGKGGFSLSNLLLAGRWPTRRFLTALATVRNPIGNEFLCGDSGVYASVKGLMCANRDITALPQGDNTNAPCDALSFAVRLTATPAKLGSVYAGPTPLQPCGPQWNDECP